jgi:hypothetical protein
LDRIAQLFDLLDEWRHLPAYQLERRADILFALYLPAFLSDRLKVRLRPQLIPEFPLRQRLNNRSCKVDYVAMSEDGNKVFFVELKTDNLSRRQRQDEYLVRAKDAGMPSLIKDVRKIFAGTKARLRPKYCHLLKLLDFHGLECLPPSFFGRQKTGWRGFKRDFASSEVPQTSREISIYYLKPTYDVPGDIGFDTFADWMDQFGDPLSSRFSASLRAWAKVTAGQAI